jgi:hypothetical protein
LIVFVNDVPISVQNRFTRKRITGNLLLKNFLLGSFLS